MSKESRHLRQAALEWCGADGQKRIHQAHAMVVGCGALGCVAIEWLARAGVGQLTLVDRDVVEWSNLQRQQLFCENDAKVGAFKAEAAAKRVGEIDSNICTHACVEHVDAQNAADLAKGVDVIVDGLDNIETRFILNDLAVRDGIPYIYCAAVSMEGRSMAVLPGGACLRCIYPELPPPGVLPTCDRVGVLGPLVGMVGAFAASQALFLLAGRADLLERKLWSVDLHAHRHATIAVSRDEHCPCCAKNNFPFLNAAQVPRAVHLCGRGAVQILPAHKSGAMDLFALQKQLQAHGSFSMRSTALHGQLAQVPGIGGELVQLTIFADGRAIVSSCDDLVVARSIYDRFIGC